MNPDPQRLILRGTGSAALGLALRAGARVAFLFIAARLFGVVLFGAFSVAVAVVEIAVTVAGLASKRLIFKLLDEPGEGRRPVHVVIDAAAAVAFAGGVLAALIAAVALAMPSSAGSARTAVAVIALAPMVIGQSLLDLLLAATRWHHKMRYEVVGRSIVEPYALTAGCVVAYAAGWREAGLLIGYWAGTIAAAAYAVAGVRRCFGGLDLARYVFDARRIAAHVRDSAVPAGNALLSGLLLRLDLLVVGALLGEGPAGIYGVARQIRTPIRQVRQSFDGLLTPLAARTLATDGPVIAGRALASAARLILAIELPVLVALIALGAPLLHWFGPAFAPGYWAMIVLALAESIQGAFGVSELIFLYRRPGVLSVVIAAAIVANLVAALALVDRFGVAGAALAVLAATLVNAGLRRVALKACFGIAAPLLHSAAPIAAAAAGTATAFGVLHGSAAPGPAIFALSAIAGLGVYALLLALWLRLAGQTLGLSDFAVRRHAD